MAFWTLVLAVLVAFLVYEVARSGHTPGVLVRMKWWLVFVSQAAIVGVAIVNMREEWRTGHHGNALFLFACAMTLAGLAAWLVWPRLTKDDG